MSSPSVNDEILSFCDIHSSSADMRQKMVEIAEHAFSRSDSREWMSLLRFLVREKLEDAEQLDSNQNLTERPDLSTQPMSITCPDRTVLKVMDRSILVDPAAYVAVSYCWNREKVDWFDAGDEPPIQVCDGGADTRSSNVPPDVLSRAVTYSKSRNINSIWIDQECIDQNDPVEKEIAIQAMDLIYEGSDHPIAILEFCFETQAELDVFASIVDPDYFEFDPTQIETLGEVLGTLVNEQWFSRAWTLQEATSAGVSMVLLIGCPGLDKPPYFGSIPGEFEISLWSFQEAMINGRNLIEEGLAANVWSDISDAIYASNCADVLWNFIPTNIPGSWTRKEVSHRQECNAAQAVVFLRHRQNSFFPDRLAILANICNYKHRITTKVLEEPWYSFSTCALTLAILNGDMSLLAGYGDAGEATRKVDRDLNWNFSLATDCRAIGSVYENDGEDLSSIMYGFSWGPKPSGSLSDLNYTEEMNAKFRLKPAILSSHGLRVCGVVWHINRAIKVPRTQQQFGARWKRELELQFDDDFSTARERQRPLMRDFIWTLLRELLDQGLRELVKTLWRVFQPLGVDETGLESYALPRPYSFTEVFGLNHTCAVTRASSAIKMEDVKNRLRSATLSVYPDLKGFQKPTIQRQLIHQVCETGAMLCGTAADLPGPLLEPRVWFQDTSEGDFVFTPFTQMGDEVVYTTYAQQAISWKVQKTCQCIDGCEVLHCLGRRGGFWRFEGLDIGEHILD